MFSPGRNQTTSPGRISSTGPPQPLHTPDAASDDQRLAEWMRVPGGPGARLEGDAGAGGARRIGRLEQRIDGTVPVNQSVGPLADGCEPFRLMSMRYLLFRPGPIFMSLWPP
jgi:hypothetical protein